MRVMWLWDIKFLKTNDDGFLSKDFFVVGNSALYSVVCKNRPKQS